MSRPKYVDPPSPQIRFWVDRLLEREAKAGWRNKCLECDTQFTRLPTGRRRHYCSNACRQKRYRYLVRGRDRDYWPNRKARAAESTLRGAERTLGRVDDRTQAAVLALRHGLAADDS